MRQEAFTPERLIDICENSLLVTGAKAMDILKCGRTKFKEKVQQHLAIYQPPGEQRKFYLYSILEYLEKHTRRPKQEAIHRLIGNGKMKGNILKVLNGQGTKSKKRRTA